MFESAASFRGGNIAQVVIGVFLSKFVCACALLCHTHGISCVLFWMVDLVAKVCPFVLVLSAYKYNANPFKSERSVTHTVKI